MTAPGSSDADLIRRVVAALSRSPLFRGLDPAALTKVAGFGALERVKPGTVLVREGAAADAFLLLLSGEATVLVAGERGEPTEVAQLAAPDVVGEMGLLLKEPRSATVEARTDVTLMRFSDEAFRGLFRSIPTFGLALCEAMARRLKEADRQMSLPELDGAAVPEGAVGSLLPAELMQRHQVMPMKLEGSRLTLGFVSDPSPRVVNAVRAMLPGLELRAVRVDRRLLDEALQARVADGSARAPTTRQREAGQGVQPGGTLPPLDALLQRVVAEGASDLHLSAEHRPRWRIDGSMKVIQDLPTLAPGAVQELLEPVMDERLRAQFAEEHDCDFAYELRGVARFRVNLFRDHYGVGAVMRQIPATILTFEQLGLPEVVRTFCELPKGLILVTGPTGSGKSTTLAAMIDYINKHRDEHIITLEDPIEFLHRSQRSLVNQREVGRHTKSFGRALKAALREDPDVVLVGELRDLETVALAIETANTGHLVFGTLHTNTAVSTVERVVGMFPVDEQPLIRAVLADSLKGVVAQTLCKRVGGGRVAALEVLVVNRGVANLVREGKTFQIPTLMTTGKGQGMQILNDALLELVATRRVAPEEAMARAVDKDDLRKRLGRAAGAV